MDGHHIPVVWDEQARPSFLCPACSRRCKHLYLDELACRTCLHLDYSSRHLHRTVPGLSRVTRLRRRIGGDERPFAPLPKRPRHHVRFHRIADEIRALERGLVGHLSGINQDLERRTEVLSWVMARATRKSFSSLLSEHVWTKLGAKEDASINIDSTGMEATGTGMSLTLRDLARLGEMIRNRGKFFGRQILPEAVFDELILPGDEKAKEVFAKAGYLHLKGWTRELDLTLHEESALAGYLDARASVLAPKLTHTFRNLARREVFLAKLLRPIGNERAVGGAGHGIFVYVVLRREKARDEIPIIVGCGGCRRDQPKALELRDLGKIR